MSDSRTHGYVRVSTKEQNEERQVNELREYGILDRDIYIDKVSGKTFDRPEYQKLLNVLREDDLLVIPSIDRLGRNYTEVQEQFKYITYELGANIKVLDMSLLDTSIDKSDIDRRFIADLVLQILCIAVHKICYAHKSIMNRKLGEPDKTGNKSKNTGYNNQPNVFNQLIKSASCFHGASSSAVSADAFIRASRFIFPSALA